MVNKWWLIVQEVEQLPYLPKNYSRTIQSNHLLLETGQETQAPFKQHLRNFVVVLLK